jgi:CspA family cold shock protein
MPDNFVTAGHCLLKNRPIITTSKTKIEDNNTRLGDVQMPSGTVKWFNTAKGFGFIAPDEGGADVFVHISAVEQSGLTGLADDEKVTYELIDGRDGRDMAGNIVKG